MGHTKYRVVLPMNETKDDSRRIEAWVSGIVGAAIAVFLDRIPVNPQRISIGVGG